MPRDLVGSHPIKLVGSPTVRADGVTDLSGSGQWAESPNSTDWHFTGDFSVEALGVEFASLSVPQTVVSFGGAAPNWGWYIVYNNKNGANRLIFAYSLNGTVERPYVDPVWQPVQNAPVDLKVDRISGVIRVYVDGVELASAPETGTINFSPDPLLIAKLAPNTTLAPGLIRIREVITHKGS